MIKIVFIIKIALSIVMVNDSPNSLPKTFKIIIIVKIYSFIYLQISETFLIIIPT